MCCHNLSLTPVHVVCNSLFMAGGELVIEELDDDAGFAGLVCPQDHDPVVGLGLQQVDSGAGAVGAVAAGSGLEGDWDLGKQPAAALVIAHRPLLLPEEL